MGHRFGGRLASAHHPKRWNRNEEHGLHVWFGFYDNTFRLATEAWRDWEAPPDCPWSTLWDGLRPIHYSDHAYLTDEGYRLWRLHHSRNADIPGRGPKTWTAQLTGILDMVRVLRDMARQCTNPARTRPRGRLERWLWPSPALHSSIRALETVLAPVLDRLAHSALPATPAARRRLGSTLHRMLVRVHPHAVSVARRLVRREGVGDQLAQWVDLLLGAARGVTDPRYGIMEDGDLDRVSHLELREFLAAQGVSSRTLAGTAIDTIYDVPFAYRHGDRRAPVLEASTALRFCARIFFGYKHALAYLLSAGAGEALIGPLYELLRARGVKFTPFHRLERLVLDEEGRRVERLDFVRAARTKGDCDPLLTRSGLRGFRADPDWAQLEDGDALQRRGVDFYSRFGDRGERDIVSFQCGRDFDDVVLALPLGCILEDADGHTPVRAWLDHYPPARACLERLHLVPSVAAQIWLDRDADAAGLRDRAVATWAAPYSVVCDMTPVIAHEGWPEPGPKSCAYLCGAWPCESVRAPSHDGQALERDLREARARLARVLEQHGPRWFGGPDALHCPPNEEHRDAAQYVRVNVEPWDLADLALPGADLVRLEAADTGLTNMALAGAWVRTPVNTTSVEAAVCSGIAAARSLRGTSREIFGEAFLRKPSRNPFLPGRKPTEGMIDGPSVISDERAAS